MLALEENRLAYAAFRSRQPNARPDLDAAIDAARRQMALLQRELACARAEELRWQNGALAAWAAERVAAHAALVELARRPWLTRLALGPAAPYSPQTAADGWPAWLIQLAGRVEERAVLIDAALDNGETLTVDLQLLRTPGMLIVAPAWAADRLSRLASAALDALAMDDALGDAVEAAALCLGLPLAARADPAFAVPPDVERAYLRQRSVWLLQDGWLNAVPGGDMTAALRDLATAERHILALVRRRDDAARADNPSAAAWAAEYDEIRALPHVAALDVRGDTITLRTDLITLQGRSIGAFEVTLDFANHTTYYVNTTYGYGGNDGYQHPHISGGSACYGNIARAVADYLARREPRKLVPLVIDYLHSYNEASVYRNISYW